MSLKKGRKGDDSTWYVVGPELLCGPHAHRPPQEPGREDKKSRFPPKAFSAALDDDGRLIGPLPGDLVGLRVPVIGKAVVLLAEELDPHC